MKDKFFIDTNIWLYGFMKNDSKNKTASIIISGANLVLSTDVLNELCLNLLDKGAYSEPEIINLIKNIYRKFEVLKNNEEILLFSSVIREKYKISYWGSIKCAIAYKNNCKVIFSDTIKNGLIIDNKLKVIDPFEQ